jgi:hypothetical protein
MFCLLSKKLYETLLLPLLLSFIPLAQHSFFEVVYQFVNFRNVMLMRGPSEADLGTP